MLYNMNDYHIELDKLGKVIIYLRKSREDMVDGKYLSDEETLSRHEGQLQEWAKRNLGYEIPQDCIFKEVGSGEKINTRPVFQQVLETLETEDISGVLVVNCSRLSRGSLGDIYQIIKTLEITDTLVLTPMKTYNLKNKYDKRFFQDELTRGNDYLEQVKELLANGRHWSVSCGKFVGSKPVYGYDIVTCKEMKVADEKGNTLRPNENAEYVKLIFDMYLNGTNIYAIYKHLIEIDAPLQNYNEWNRNYVRSILTNVTYKGYLTWGFHGKKEKMVNGEVVEYRPKNEECPTYKGLHDPIIDEETFDKVQDMLKKANQSRVPKQFQEKNPLSGLIKCSVCGRAIVRHTYSGISKVARKHELDKLELKEFIVSYKKKTNYSNRELGRILGITHHQSADWFGKGRRFYPTKLFASKWFELKKLLKIDDDRFDEIVTQYEEKEKEDTLRCNNLTCTNVSSYLKLVEESILDAIKVKYEEYTHYLSNYEQEFEKIINKNKKSVQSIDKQIATIQTQLKNVQIAFEKEAYTLDEFVTRKKELNEELAELNAKKESLGIVQEEEKIIRIKKSVPILKNIIDTYYSCSVDEKNELLKTIIDRVYYLKERSGANCGDNKEVLKEFKLEISWLID